MIGRKLNWYWKVMWAFASPLLIISLFIFYLTDYILTGTLQYQAWDGTQVKQLFIYLFILIPSRIQPSFLKCPLKAAGIDAYAFVSQQGRTGKNLT